MGAGSEATGRPRWKQVLRLGHGLILEDIDGCANEDRDTRKSFAHILIG